MPFAGVENRKGPREIVVKCIGRIATETTSEALSLHTVLASMNIPVYINESLTTGSRKLFAVTRLANKEKGYKHLWIRGGCTMMSKC